MKFKLDPSSSAQLSWPKFLAFSTICIAIVIALLNPSSTQELSIAQRALFWLIQVSALLTMMQVMQLALQKLSPFFKWPIFVQLALSGFIGAALFVPIGTWLDGILGLDEPTVTLPRSWYLEFLEELAFVSPPAVAAWLGLNAIRLRGALGVFQDRGLPVTNTDQTSTQPRGSTDVNTGSQESKTEPLKLPFVDLLPPPLGTDLVALSAELHYTRVYTFAGQALIFYPFGRAIEELKEVGYPGVQVHRSHWVAQDHILQKKRLKSSGFLQTDTGLKIPVSRRRKNDLSQIL
ncbi:MAG: LytTR family DNA-binding domain-containing protein [Hyphomonadaceae bacterium]